jgi:putative membrane protein
MARPATLYRTSTATLTERYYPLAVPWLSVNLLQEFLLGFDEPLRVPKISAKTGSRRKLMAQIDSSTKLSVNRTRLSYERTMMAWIRTGTSLITFGFSIYKFFQIEIAKSTPISEGPLGSGNFAMLMIAIGLGALIIATLENRRELNALKSEYPNVHFPRSLARIFAALVSILGILALVAVILRK